MEAAGLKSPDLCFTERRELKFAEIQQNGALKRYQIDAELNLKREQPG